MEQANMEVISDENAVSQLFRSELWQTCLGVQNQDKETPHCSVTFGLGILKRNLVHDSSLKEDCVQFLVGRGSGDVDQASAVENLESIILFHLESEKIKYARGNGWIEVIEVLLSLKLHVVITYRMFKAVQKKYILPVSDGNTTPFNLFRLLVLYHVPEMCSFLDSKRVHPKLYSCTWFLTLFAHTCSLNVVQELWDSYFGKSDPFLIFFLALVLLLHGKENLLEMRTQSQEQIVAMLETLPCSLQPEDIPDFFTLADYYASKTPSSFKSPDLMRIMLNPSTPTDLYSQELCLNIGVDELHRSIEEAKDANKECIRYFIIDCRPEVQYMSGHLPTAFHLDCDLVVQQPSVFRRLVDDLLVAQRRALAAASATSGEHLCFIGSGRNDEDQYLNMVVAAFLQRHTQHVSILAGGYQSIHLYLAENLINCDAYFIDHNPGKCLVCLKDSPRSAKSKIQQIPTKPSPGVLQKLKGTTSEIFSCHLSSNCKGHVSKTDNTSKLYRNVRPVFTIDEDLDDGCSVAEEETGAVIKNRDYFKDPATIDVFKCGEISLDGCRPTYSGHLVLEKNCIVILRDIIGQSKYSRMVCRRSYENVVKITSPNSNPHLITFRYDNSHDDDSDDVIVDKYLLDKDSNIFLKHVFEQIKNIDK